MNTTIAIIISITIIFLSTNGIAANKVSKSEKQTEQTTSCASYFIYKDDAMENFINGFFKLKDKNPEIVFEGEYFKLLNQYSQEKSPDKFGIAYILYTLLALHFDDRISCAKTQDKIDEITKLKESFYVMGGGLLARNKLETLAPLPGSSMTQDQADQVKYCYFNHTIPFVIKFYNNHPSRKYCK